MLVRLMQILVRMKVICSKTLYYECSFGSENSRGLFIEEIEEIVNIHAYVNSSPDFKNGGSHLFRQLGNIVLMGIETAFWDILGKEVGKPIHALLGGKVRDNIDYVYYMPKGDKDWVISRSKNVLDQGFNTLFIKVIDPDEAVDLIRDLRAEIGDEPKIRIDPNESWIVGTAIKTIKRLESFNLEAVEQPILIFDLPGMVQVQEASNIPIILDQASRSDYDIMTLIRSEAADILTADPFYIGGLWSCKKAPRRS